MRHRDFRLFWVGMVLQAVGNWVQQVAIGWLLLDLTSSALALGLGSLFQAAPFLLVSLWGGVLADRIDRRRLLQYAQAAAIVVAAATALLSALGAIQVWHLYAVSLAIGAIGGIDAPARTALIPSLVPRADLMRAVALTAVIRRGTALLGPMVGGLVLAASGPSATFALVTLFSLAMFVATALMQPRGVALESGRRSMARSLLDGLAYIGKRPILRATFIVEATTQALMLYAGVLPLFARDVLGVGPEGLGLLYAAPGLGAVLASVLMTVIGEVRHKGRFFMATALAKPVVMGVFALSPWMPLSLAMLALYGFLDVAGGTVRTTMIQLVTAEQVRGRVMSVDNMVHRGLGTLAGLNLGAAAAVLGAPLALLLGTVVTLAVGAAQFGRLPALRRYGADEDGRAALAAERGRG